MISVVHWWYKRPRFKLYSFKVFFQVKMPCLFTRFAVYIYVGFLLEVIFNRKAKWLIMLF